MTTKRCGICKEQKSLLLDFNKNNLKKDGLQSACKACSAARSAAYYKRKTEHHKGVTKANKAAIRARNSQFVWDYLLQHPCVDCGENDPIVLEFDHLRDKTCAISVLAQYCSSISKIEEEIAKCEVRCAHCHRRKTAKDFNWYANISTGL